MSKIVSPKQGSSSTASPQLTGAGQPVPTCPECGGKLPARTVAGLCPRCLMGLAMDPAGRENSAAGSTEQNQGSPATSGDELPSQFGRYEVVRELGRGAMGVVYLARDTELDRLVAIKVPQFGRCTEQAVFERFQREVRAAAAVQHPHICPIYDVGRIDGVVYMTMAYIEGKPLSRLLGRRVPIGVRQAVLLIRKLALALAEAHRQGVVHRDLKPSNILINLRGEPVIVDFGLAQRAESDDVRLTRSGTTVGTPAYMSPEQAHGKLSEVGPASDIYSLGAVLYETLTQRPPFVGSLAEMLAQIIRDPPRRPSELRPDVGDRLEGICLKALAKKSADRFGSMDDFARALAEFALAEQATAAPAIEPPPAPPTSLLADSQIHASTRTSVETSVASRIHARFARLDWKVISASIAGVAVLLLLVLIVRDGWLARDNQGSRPKSPMVRNDNTSNDPATVNEPAADEKSRAESTPDEARRPVKDDEDSVDGKTLAANSAEAAKTKSPAVDVGKSGGTDRPVEPTSPTKTATDIPEPTKPAAANSAAEKTAANANPPAVEPAPKAPAAESARLLSAAEVAADRLARLRRLGEDRVALSNKIREHLTLRDVKLRGAQVDATSAVEKATTNATRLAEEGQVLQAQIADIDRRSGNSNENQIALQSQRRRVVMELAAIGPRFKAANAEVQQARKEVTRLEEQVGGVHRQLDLLGQDAYQLLLRAVWLTEPTGTLEDSEYADFADLFTQWLHETGDQAELLTLRSLSHTNAHAFGPAEADVEKALTLQPQSPLAMTARGYLRFRRGQAASAQRDLSKAVTLAPKESLPRLLRGLKSRDSGSEAKAYEDFAAAVEHDTSNPWCLSYLASLHLSDRLPKHRDPEKAVTISGKAMRATEPLSWFCYQTRAQALAAAGDTTAAAAAQRQAVELAPRRQQEACRALLRELTD